MAYRTMDSPTFGDSLRLGVSFPTHVSSLPAPSLSKRKLFAIFSPYGPIYFVARAPNLLDVPASGRKGNSRVAALADCWRLRSVVGGSGGSSHLDSSEPNSQKQLEEKTGREKIVRQKRKRSPKPNVDVGSVLGFYLLFGFCRRWVL